MKTHGLLEDVGAELGFTATSALVDWFAGFGQIAIPLTAEETHPIAQVIGMPAYRRLVKMYEGAEPTERFLWINQGENREIARRDRLIAFLLAVGQLNSKQIATIAGISESQVRYSQLRVNRLGILPMLMRRVGLGKPMTIDLKSIESLPLADEVNTLAKLPGKKSRQKPGVKAGAKPSAKPTPKPGVKPSRIDAQLRMTTAALSNISLRKR